VPRIVEAVLTDADGGDRVCAETLAEIKRSVLLGTTLLVASLDDGRRLAGLPPGDRDVDAGHVALLLLTIGVDAVLLEGIAEESHCTDLVVGDALVDGELMIDCAGASRPGRRAVLAAGTAAGLAAGRDLTDAIRAAEAFARDTLTTPA
jgi:hydroxymethylpyrimidine/phosphomethylpyrimidine kinase